MISTPLGQVVADAGGMRLEFVRTLDTHIDDAWSAITDSDRTARWFGSWTGDPATGRIEVVMTAEDDSTPQTVEIVECTAPTRLVLDVPGPEGNWRLSIDLSANGDTTEMVFTQRLADRDDTASVGPGWHFYLDRLGAVIDERPVPDDFGSYLAAFEHSYPLPES